MHRCAHSGATALLLVSLLAACAHQPAASSPVLPAGQAGAQAARRASQAAAPPSSQPAPSETPPRLALPLAPTPVPKGAALYTAVPIPEEDAAVLAQAASDIPRYRQGDLVLSVVDADGKPLAGYQVRYRQVSHDFWFGAFAAPYDVGVLRDAGLNMMVVNPVWYWVEPELGDFTLGFANHWLGIDELASGGLKLKTNDMFCMGDTDMRPYWRDIPFEEFLERLHNHVSTLVQRFAPAVDQWEAILEPNMGNHNPLNLTEDQYYEAIATSVGAIRAADPTAVVEINLSYPCGGIDWLDNEQIVRELLRRDVDFDVIGLQFYYNACIGGAPPYEMPALSLSQLSACYDRYEALLAPSGKAISVSEISVPSQCLSGAGYWGAPWSEDLQAQYLQAVYTLLFSKPSNRALVWWNTVEPSSFVMEGGLVDEQGRPKKAYNTLRQLIDSWTTDGEGVTGADGLLTIRGYAGDYELTVVNPESGAATKGRAHIREQQAQTTTLVFAGDAELAALRTRLEALVAYWEARPDAALAQRGRDSLALAADQLGRGERDSAQKTLLAGLADLRATETIHLSASELHARGQACPGPILQNGEIVMWQSQALCYPLDLPPGVVRIDVTARGTHAGSGCQGEEVGGVWPTLVVGVGANYSQRMAVDSDTSAVYSATLPLTGDERVLTIRDLWSGCGDAGEWKLYVEDVTLTFQTEEPHS